MVDSGTSYRDKVSQLISWGHWFSFFNIIAAMLLGTRYISQSGWPETLLGQSYLVFNWVGHFGFLVFALYILIIFPASFLIPSQRLMRLFAVLVATVGMMVLLLDIYAYQTLHLHLNPLVWELLLSGEKTDMNAHWQYLFIAVPAIFILELIIAEWVWRKLRKLTRKRIGIPVATVFALCFISSHLIHIWADAFIYSPVTAQRSTFPVSYPMTAKTFMEKYGLLDRQEYQRLREQRGQETSEVIRYPLQPLAFAPDANKYQKNLLMVMVEGLRADMVNPVTMPHLHQFANQNLWFKNHFSSSNDDMAGLFGFFYGLPGSYAQSARTEGLRPVLIETLKQRDYQLGLFSGDHFANPIYYQSIFSQALERDSQSDKPAWQADAEAVSTMQNWLGSRETDKPWFGYLELATVNEYEQGGDYPQPFQPALDSAMAGVDTQTSLVLKNSYNNAAHYVDDQLGRLLEHLGQSGQLDNTVVMITANHGMEFNETGLNSWGSNSNYSRYQLQVPMIMHWPNQNAEQTAHYSSHLDVAPTLMESMLSVSSPAETYSSGTNLFELKNRPRKWVLAGDSRDIVVVQPQKTTVVDKFGNYKVFDKHYTPLPEGKPQLSLLMQVMHELKRFYYPEEPSS
ncbi:MULTISPECIES: DUF3413 domain-containing protein [Salinivibrio]|uniref:Hydrolase n=1 Tax=Salinivibrio kushneri TaxID=1908198 RepID=A0AB36K8Q1_9GAMM|nr:MULTISPECIES: DUF3413 domain-containing protein [Salinivibrio]ODP97675.1 hydrolase [Salinivibrio sp. BNH]OOE35041.1 hydrolase [Salinivibrio kushneri]OOE36909.1 hydrolase [Salinivibrio kushneri]OOE38845.1 hydrolase [Salinivibrio kushneri]OOE46559.1 hydrolase [Salinivibrio kushneri]